MQPGYVNSAGLIPAGSDIDRQGVAFYAGRQVAAPANISPPALLCVPEFGIIYDSMYELAFGVVPNPCDLEASRWLLLLLRCGTSQCPTCLCCIDGDPFRATGRPRAL